MAAIASTTIREISPSMGMQIMKGTVTTTGDTFRSKFGQIRSVQISDRTTSGGARATFSAGTVTVACTSGDVVDMIIFGD